ncbi:ExbD/TolR family protein [Reinekea marinisedimentorum]|uniref:Biopolymer transport protein ExbD n=1 Tax=Reinekea marinisedimentorum TaxID=230495 RepID=A0A4R3IBC5_9GAMM|nr:biopolymer transporter ExbD [Reinekea marinisedimentorum]TCS42571.1 biopolymer transport protein ExbD [Reinekea marinisedimentorum]
MRFRRSRHDDVNVNITPLIDVVFLLLIFFMVTTTFTRETQLQIDLPESQSQVAAEDQKPIEILIDRTGTYALNGQVLIKSDIESLKQALAEVSTGNLTKPIVLTGDAEAPHQAFVIALDAVAQLGFVKVSITTQAESSE